MELRNGSVWTHLSKRPGVFSYMWPGRRAHDSWHRDSRILFISCLFPSCFFKADGRGFLSIEIHRTRVLLSVIQRELLNSLPGITNVPLDTKDGVAANSLPLPLFLMWESVPYSPKVHPSPRWDLQYYWCQVWWWLTRKIKFLIFFFSSATVELVTSVQNSRGPTDLLKANNRLFILWIRWQCWISQWPCSPSSTPAVPECLRFALKEFPVHNTMLGT